MMMSLVMNRSYETPRVRASLPFHGVLSSNRISPSDPAPEQDLVDDPLRVQHIGYVFLVNRGAWRMDRGTLEALLFNYQSLLLLANVTALSCACAHADPTDGGEG